MVLLILRRSVVFHLSSLLSWSYWKSYCLLAESWLRERRVLKRYLVSEHLLVSVLYGLGQIHQQLVLSLLDKTRVQIPVSVECSIHTNLIARAQLANAGLE